MDYKVEKEFQEFILKQGLIIVSKRIDQEMIINDKHRFSHALENLRYIMQGESIANVPRYNQRKLAIEYITPNEIPMSDVSLVGKTHVNPEIVNKAHWEMRDLPNVWRSLTEGMPEAKSFEYMV